MLSARRATASCRFDGSQKSASDNSTEADSVSSDILLYISGPVKSVLFEDQHVKRGNGRRFAYATGGFACGDGFHGMVRPAVLRLLRDNALEVLYGVCVVAFFCKDLRCGRTCYEFVLFHYFLRLCYCNIILRYFTVFVKVFHKIII